MENNLDFINNKSRGRKKYIGNKSHTKRKKSRERSSSPPKGNSLKICSWCCPELSHRMENKKQIEQEIKQEIKENKSN